MAAVLCKPITSCIEFICTAPCKLCAGGCNLCADGLVGLCTNPLSAFVVITFAIQIPLAVLAALEVGGLFNGCKESRFLVGMLVVAISHMAASVYLANRIMNRTDERLRDRHTSWSRISYLLCHDAWIALYLLILIFYVIWLIMGSIGSIANRGDDSSDCGDDTDYRVTLVLVLGWVYLFVGPMILSCNLCCSCCDKTDYAATDEEYARKEAEKEAKKKQRYSTTAAPSTSNNFHNDIEAPNNPPPQEAQQMPEPYAKAATSPPKTYSTEGVPINDDGNVDIVEAEVLVEEGTLPPAMAPPSKSDFTAQSELAKAGTKAQAMAEKGAKSFGGWLNKKNKGSGGDGGDSKPPPEKKATVY